MLQQSCLLGQTCNTVVAGPRAQLRRVLAHADVCYADVCCADEAGPERSGMLRQHSICQHSTYAMLTHSMQTPSTAAPRGRPSAQELEQSCLLQLCCSYPRAQRLGGGHLQQSCNSAACYSSVAATLERSALGEAICMLSSANRKTIRGFPGSKKTLCTSTELQILTAA